jgi:hypothetical protein
MIDKIEKHFPLLLSYRFWGIVVTVAAMQLVYLGWIPESLGEFIYQVTGFATAVGVIDRVGSKSV